MLTTVVLIVVMLLLSAFFSGMEIAFTSKNRLKLEIDRKQNRMFDQIAEVFARHPGQYITTILVGNNIALVVYSLAMSLLLRETYGSKIKVFGTEIPHSVRAKEISAEGKSIFAHDPGGKVAEGYKNLTKEVLKLEKQREKNRAGLGR